MSIKTLANVPSTQTLFSSEKHWRKIWHLKHYKNTNNIFQYKFLQLEDSRGGKNLETVQFYTLKLTNERQLTHWLRSCHSQAVNQVMRELQLPKTRTFKSLLSFLNCWFQIWYYSLFKEIIL